MLLNNIYSNKFNTGMFLLYSNISQLHNPSLEFEKQMVRPIFCTVNPNVKTNKIVVIVMSIPPSHAFSQKISIYGYITILIQGAQFLNHLSWPHKTCHVHLHVIGSCVACFMFYTYACNIGYKCTCL